MRAATSLAPLKRGSQHGWMDALSQFFPAHYGTHRVAATLHFSEYRLRERDRSCGVLTPAECHTSYAWVWECHAACLLCRACDEIRQFFRIRSPMKQKITLAFQREAFCQRTNVLKTLFSEA